MLGKYQFICWFPEWKGFKFHNWIFSNYARFFDVSYFIGWFEIRVWQKDAVSPSSTATTEEK